MWVKGQWKNECETVAYIRQLEQERDSYKQELIKTYQDYLTCAGGDKDCMDCKYVLDENGMFSGAECPSKLSKYSCKLRLEELKKEESA